MDKSYLKSKTLWVSLIVALVPLFPSLAAQIKAHPDYAYQAVAVIFGVLRVVTKGKIVLVEDKAVINSSGQ